MCVSLAPLGTLDHTGDAASFSPFWRVCSVLPPQRDHRDTPRPGNAGAGRGTRDLSNGALLNILPAFLTPVHVLADAGDTAMSPWVAVLNFADGGW